MPVHSDQPDSTPKNRALDRLRTAVREQSPPRAPETDGAAPRGNQAPDDGEVRKGQEKLSTVLGH